MSEQTSAGIRPSGFRLPERSRLGAVRLQVSDLDRSLAYYSGVLGFRVLDHADHEAHLGAGDDRQVLVSLVGGSGIRPVPRRGTLGLYHFAILLPDRTSLARFVRHLADVGTRAGLSGMSDHAVSEAVYLTDPDGLGIEVYADRPQTTWRYHGGQLLMTTRPLDVRGLVAEAGDTAWDGMPAGTRMGHVHLHVGDLDEAVGFYHSALGFDKVVWDYPGAVFLSAGGYHHHLGMNTWSSGQPAADNQARLLSWDIVVPREDDAAAAAHSLARAGYPATFEEGPRAWRATDPWGTTLRITTEPEEDES